MNAAQHRRLTPFLIAAAIVLAALWLLLLAGAGRAVRWGAPRSPVPLPPASAANTLPGSLPLQQFALVWHKPLFSPDRRQVLQAADGSSLGDLELTGILLTPTLRMALLHDRQGNRDIRLHEGESLADSGVTLVEVRSRSVLFDAPTGRAELKLPAGAPIDQGKADSPAQAGTSHRDDGMVPPPPSAPSDHPAKRPPPAAIQRLKQIIQKRRAEQAAARQGVR
jgi:general secretion pathway protein N